MMVSQVYRISISHQIASVQLQGVERSGTFVLTKIELNSDVQVCSKPHPVLQDYSNLIWGYLDGSVQDLSGIPLDYSLYTAFQYQILTTARSIPYGAKISYSVLAQRAGFPRAIRAVATVMRKNRYPLVIPCHRVVRNDGTAGGYCGSMEGPSATLKRTLLSLEEGLFRV